MLRSVITGELRSKIDRLWDAFWSGGISNPLEVIEQITYLMFIKRLDGIQTTKENKANRTGKPIESPIYTAETNPDCAGRSSARCQPEQMYEVVADGVFPWLRQLGGDDSTYSHHMKDARFTIPTPNLLAKAVDALDELPLEHGDIKGDLYEYMLSKIATAGQNGQFRTPRHIIQLMVEMMNPGPQRRDLRPSLRHGRVPGGRGGVCPARALRSACWSAPSSGTSTTACSTASTSTPPCCASPA